MKLTTIALASAFALSSTFALAGTSHHKYRTHPAGYSKSYGQYNGGYRQYNRGYSQYYGNPNNRGGLVGGMTRAPTDPKSKRRVSAGLFYALFDRSSVYGAALKRN